MTQKTAHITPTGCMSVAEFATTQGITHKKAVYLCRMNRVFGASKHPITKKWWIYPPAKLLTP